MILPAPIAKNPPSQAEAFVVRALAVRDADAAAEIIRAAFAAQSRVTNPPSSALRETTDSVAARLAAGGGFGAFDRSRLVAAALWQIDGDALVVGRVCALPEARGQSLSRRLIAACETAARTHGLERLRLRARLELPENEALFQRLGFARVRVETHPGFEAPTVAVMEKRLP